MWKVKANEREGKDKDLCKFKWKNDNILTDETNIQN